MATADRTREDDGSTEAPSETCIVVRYAGRSEVIEVRDHTEVVIGRSSEATFRADDERVSRRHLQIKFHDGALRASDLGSRNGTTINGRKLASERALSPGDELAAGPVRVSVCGTRRMGPIASEDEWWTRLQSELERALRFSRPLSLLGFALPSRDQAVKVASKLGWLERLGEWTPGEYLILLPETPLAQAKKRAADLGIAARAVAAPEHGRAASSLVAAALAHGATMDEPAAVETPPLVAEDAAMKELVDLAHRAARSDTTILLSGETGSGKEVIAGEIHRRSARAQKPFVRVNLASLPSTLLEPELFGHERGAFTGAERRRIGYIEAAQGGTLLLDEIGELPVELQAKLLRVLEERKVTRVGGEEPIAVDVRFIAATHRDLDAEVAAGRFRRDLFFRINTITLKIPPLRERPLDLAQLAQSFAGRSLSAELLAVLAKYPWPGNVRELKNVIERALVLCDGPELSLEHLPHRLSVLQPAPMREQLDELEKRNLVEALKNHGGNRTHAARALGISRRSLIYKLKKYEID